MPGEAVLELADAIRRHRRIETSYRSYSGATSLRELSPYGLVVHAGRWYLAAHDHGREASRIFRVDRMRNISVSAKAVLAPPDDFDAVAYVSHSLATVPWTWDVEVLLEIGSDRAAERIPPTLAELSDADGKTLLHMRVESLDWMARLLAGLDCDFTVLRPDELRVSLGRLAARLAAAGAA